MSRKDLAFRLTVKNKELMKNKAVRKWLKETEIYLNIKLQREVDHLVSMEMKRQTALLLHGTYVE